MAVYINSKGQQVPIATMAGPHLLNARDKLVREGDPSRAAEIEAMNARLADLESNVGVEAVGGNNPPPPVPTLAKPVEIPSFVAISAHLDDLLMEARNWADGTKVETAAQAAEVDRLIDDLSDGMGVADGARVIEKKPLDDMIDEIQTRFNFYIAPLKNKVPGKVPLAIKALTATVTPWRLAEEARKLAEAEEARKLAQAKADEAAAAMRAADPANLAGREEAEAIFQEAATLTRVANRAEKVATTGTGLRSTWTPTLTDGVAAARYYWGAEREKCEEFFLSLARVDVRNGKRLLPGFTITEDRKAI